MGPQLAMGSYLYLHLLLNTAKFILANHLTPYHCTLEPLLEDRCA